MRLQRGTLVSGIEPELAREVARLCHWEPVPASYIAARRDVSDAEARKWLEQLEADGYLERSQGRDWDGGPKDTQDEWTTTARGGALAGASFLKPITRAKAEALLDGVLHRARAYNDDPDKPLWIDEVTVFGSFLDPEAADLGDLDIHYASSRRYDDQERAVAYARQSGRRFASFIEELFWPQKELSQVLKNRSGYISLTTENLSQLTDRFQVVYRRER
ncbi:hypothetical protein [Nocardioides pinisoli]|uniref:Uncharacterized protein n=1 Tax=Nocardioides pinisoli TaxID=2950279 RepID=A0ABT1KRE4_9ACTN|nr:hypothetical protein [Nocardioides pinisoli]MCP3420316.1 hypothetical protein [Nocardioides pinisoli]